jgi:DNA end-binding protein Ku
MEKASSRPVWSGSISFGLVTIPVKLFTAVREKRLSFRSLHDQDKVPLKQKLVCPADGKEVHAEHIVKGYEIEKDQYVVIRQEELEAVAPKATRAIEIQDFVDLDDIDPVFFDRPYYVAARPEGMRPYKLLVEAMEKKKKVGIAKIVMHTKEYLAALRPVNGILCLETMHFGDEVVDPKGVAEEGGKGTKVDAREIKMAEQLIDSLSTDFKPSAYHDEYRERVMEMIQKKARGEKVVMRPESEEAPVRGHGLMAALEASLKRAKNGASTGAVNGNGHAHARTRTTRRRRSA